MGTLVRNGLIFLNVFVIFFSNDHYDLKSD